MSIEEFLDGCPMFDERNFTNFKTNSKTKTPVYISTVDQPNAEVIINEQPKNLFNYVHRSWTAEYSGQKRKFDDTEEESVLTGPSTSKRSLIEN